ncbi:unnamed protein product, partial [Meganyctiphanes norvegica]
EMRYSPCRILLILFILTNVCTGFDDKYCNGVLNMLVPHHLCLMKSIVGKMERRDYSADRGCSAGFSNADYAVDVAIRNFKSLVPETQAIPDIGTWFNLKHCSLNGLQSGLSRSGKSTFWMYGDTMRLEARLKAKNLRVKCSWRKDLGIFGVSPFFGNAEGKSQIVTIKALLTMDMKPGAEPVLQKFEVDSVDPIKTEITGVSGTFSWVAQQIANTLIARSEKELRSTVSKDTKDILQEQLREYFGQSGSEKGNCD